MSRQWTVREPVTLKGIGLHSGASTSVTLRPAPPNSGVVFVRTDLPRPVEIPARISCVVDSAFATTLGRGHVRIGTVEHLLAAVYLLELDNLQVDVSGPEIPILDGSATPFVDALLKTGFVPQAAPARVLQVKKTVEVREGQKRARLDPAPHFSVDCTIDFRNAAVAKQRISLGGKTLVRDVASARTFGFLEEVQQLQAVGLARGGSLENAIVLDAERVLNPEGLRFPDEFARHKVLDALGDLALVGIRVVGQLTLVRSGHSLHHRLVQSLLSDTSAYEVASVRAPKASGEHVRVSLASQVA